MKKLLRSKTISTLNLESKQWKILTKKHLISISMHLETPMKIPQILRIARVNRREMDQEMVMKICKNWPKAWEKLIQDLWMTCVEV